MSHIVSTRNRERAGNLQHMEVAQGMTWIISSKLRNLSRVFVESTILLAYTHRIEQKPDTQLRIGDEQTTWRNLNLAHRRRIELRREENETEEQRHTGPSPAG